MGRPKLPARELRGEVLMLRLRANEKRAILRAAHLAGGRHTVWIRNVLLRAARRAGAAVGR